MKLAVLGDAAGNVGAVAKRQRGVSEVVTVDADDGLSGGDWIGVIVSGETAGASRLARVALAGGLQVLLVGGPLDDAAGWDDLVQRAPDGLTLSRPLRFDPHIAGATAVVRAGTVGVPRTLDIGWSFGGEVDITTVAELVDGAALLLDSPPVAIYAIASDVAGPRLIKVNLLTANGGIAAIETAGESADLPPQRSLHLLASVGEIVHRIGHDDLLWSDGRAAPLSEPIGLDDLRAEEVSAWLSGGSGNERLVRGEAVRWSLAVSHAISRSLATGESVSIGEEGSRS